MDSHTTSSSVYRLDVLEPGRRRRWTAAEKSRIVEEISGAWGSVSATARRYGLSTSQLFAWRKACRDGRLVGSESSGFAPAVIVAEERPSAVVAGSGRMEIVLCNGRRVVVGTDVEAAALARVVAALEAV